jgi:hypothetical protein
MNEYLRDINDGPIDTGALFPISIIFLMYVAMCVIEVI